MIVFVVFYEGYRRRDLSLIFSRLSLFRLGFSFPAMHP